MKIDHFCCIKIDHGVEFQCPLGHVAAGFEPPVSMALSFDDIVRPLTVEQFIQQCWGVKPFSSTLRSAVLERLQEGFHRGEVAPVLAECRKVDNSAYSADEVSEMERDLDSARRTLNLPYCFCDGALDLSAAFIKCCGHLANDVEVGVYFSEVGGDVATWHHDNNHNITIQLYGQKEWYTLPGELAADASVGMHDLPRNRSEQLLHTPAAGMAHCACHNLSPGSVLYLPPGHWHSVVPLEGGSLSVDLRAANLTQAKWLCEALYASMMASRTPLAMLPHAPAASAASLGALTEQLTASLPAILGSCQVRSLRAHLRTVECRLCAAQCQPECTRFGPVSTCERAAAHARGAATSPLCVRRQVPRCLPFERSCSDGLNRGATLAFLKRRGCAVAPHLAAESDVRISPLVALSLKLRGADGPGMHGRGLRASLRGVDRVALGSMPLP